MQVKFSDHTDMHNCLFIPPRKEVWGAVYKNHLVRQSVCANVSGPYLSFRGTYIGKIFFSRTIETKDETPVESSPYSVDSS